MSTKSKVGWIALAIVVLAIVSVTSTLIGGILAAVLAAWSIAVFSNAARSAIGGKLFKVPATNRSFQINSSVVEFCLAFFLAYLAAKGSGVRSEREEKEKARLAEVQRETDQRAAAAKDADLRQHCDEAVTHASKAIALALKGLQDGDYSTAQRSLAEAREIVLKYSGLNPPIASINSLAGQVHDVDDDLSTIGNVKSALSDGASQLADATTKIKDKDYIAADKILDTLGTSLVVSTRAAAYVPMADVKKLSATVQSKRRSIAGGLKKQQAQLETAEVYARLCGQKPEVSAWDGAIIGLKSHIKEDANDPDSIEVEKCTIPRLTDKRCWVSTCNVRGKNGFGGLVLLRKTYSFSTLGTEEVM